MLFPDCVLQLLSFDFFCPTTVSVSWGQTTRLLQWEITHWEQEERKTPRRTWPLPLPTLLPHSISVRPSGLPKAGSNQKLLLWNSAPCLLLLPVIASLWRHRSSASFKMVKDWVRQRCCQSLPNRESNLGKLWIAAFRTNVRRSWWRWTDHFYRVRIKSESPSGITE